MFFNCFYLIDYRSSSQLYREDLEEVEGGAQRVILLKKIKNEDRYIILYL